MALGTAGLTAMLAILALESHGLSPGERPVLVTGAGGGVGSLAVMLLARAGYSVSVSTGRQSVHDDLRRLGATEILDRQDVSRIPERPVVGVRWSGAIDTVGGTTLAGILPAMAPGSAIASCGNAGGNSFESNVLPFILRGVSILGIDSTNCAIERRRVAWERLARDTDLDVLDSLTIKARLDDLPGLAERILAGQIHGRVVVNPLD
jgi:acrylyl-CoA reductase (NADPH)